MVLFGSNRREDVVGVFCDGYMPRELFLILGEFCSMSSLPCYEFRTFLFSLLDEPYSGSGTRRGNHISETIEMR